MKKIFISFLIFLICINIFCYSLAADDNIKIVTFYRDDNKTKETTLKLPQGFGSDYKYFLIFVDYGSRGYDYHAIFSNSKLYCKYKNDYFNTYGFATEDETALLYYSTDCYNSYANEVDWSNKTMSNFTSVVGYIGYSEHSLALLRYSNVDILSSDGSVFHSADESSFNAPYIVNTKENLESGKFNFVRISAGDLNLYSDEFGFAILDVTSGILNPKPVKTFVLNSSSEYFRAADLQVYYDIPQQDLGIDISNGKKYMFVLTERYTHDIYNSVTFLIGNLTTEEEIKNKQDLTNEKLDEQTNAIRDQTQVIKEQTETNKNIFERIGELLSYINPFSENFFVYKLIELLIEAIKSLFIPGDDFFGNYFTELKNWFSDRLGFLFYPFELILDILNKILNVDFSDPIFYIPDLYEPFTNSLLISATAFNLNDIIQNGVFKTVHDIYFICVDAFVVFGLVNLAKRKWEEVTKE